FRMDRPSVIVWANRSHVAPLVLPLPPSHSVDETPSLLSKSGPPSGTTQDVVFVQEVHPPLTPPSSSSSPDRRGREVRRAKKTAIEKMALIDEHEPNEMPIPKSTPGSRPVKLSWRDKRGIERKRRKYTTGREEIAQLYQKLLQQPASSSSPTSSHPSLDSPPLPRTHPEKSSQKVPTESSSRHCLSTEGAQKKKERLRRQRFLETIEMKRARKQQAANLKDARIVPVQRRKTKLEKLKEEEGRLEETARQVLIKLLTSAIRLCCGSAIFKRFDSLVG
ncbi:hypothetical protein PMAYCL1PPCAC_28402, partial [Pristionchus mayeri]